MDCEIIVVSGLPRSGTSLMMQMLESGGLDVVTDNIRAADVDNPRGYYEFEQVKSIKQDASWLPNRRGKAVKMVSQLLYDLPASERYRIIFMERDLDETLLSQERMLRRIRQNIAPREELKRSSALHLRRLHAWLRRQRNMEVLRVSYNELLQDPAREAGRVSEFLDGTLSVERMVRAVDRSLYRNRRNAADRSDDLAGGGSV